MNYKAYLLPGIVFQTLVIAGGYGTGQEFVQFFLRHGAIEGLFGLILSGILWSFICALSFIHSYRYHSYHYSDFFNNLIGKYSKLFDICYILLIMIILSVVLASMKEIIQPFDNITQKVLLLAFILCIYQITLLNTQTLEKIFSFWSIFLAITYTIFLFMCLRSSTPQIAKTLTPITITNTAWLQSGIQYAAYNLGLIPAVLFSTSYISSKSEAIGAGIFCGFWSIFPGILFYLAMLGHMPEILTKPLPSVYILETLHTPWLYYLFNTALIGTLIGTSVGLLQTLCKKTPIMHTASSRKVIIISIFLSLSLLISQAGLSQVILHGYGIIAWCIFCIFCVPLLIKYTVRKTA